MAKYVKTEEGYKSLDELSSLNDAMIAANEALDLIGGTSVSSQIESANALKMDKNNPTGTGSLSLNRKAGTTVGSMSVADGSNTSATAKCAQSHGIGTVANFANRTATGSYNTYNTYEASSNRSVVYKVASSSAQAATGTTYSHPDALRFQLDGTVNNFVNIRDLKVGQYFMTQWANSTSSGSVKIGTSVYRVVSNEEYDSTQRRIGYYIYTMQSSDSTNVGKYVHVVGNGTSDTVRSNAHTLDWEGNAWFAGDVKVGGAGQDDAEAKVLATQEYVDESITTLIGDTSVSDQITTAINSITPESLGFYVQSTEPANAAIGAIWVDTSVTSVSSAEGVEF